MGFLKKHFFLFFITVLSVFSILPLFQSGFFPMHDDTQIARVYEMGKALKDGMFPVRWVSDLGYGYGYPIFNFYAPLAYYVGGLFNILGFDALLATKIMMGLGVIFSGLFMYLLTREFFGELGGTVAGLFYLYAPYHALDIYVRGDVSEFYAYAFIPLMFLGFYKVFKEKYQISNIKYQISNFRWIAIGSVGYAGVILSHNLTAMMVTPFLLIVVLLYCYIAYKNKKIFTSYYLLFTILLGLLLSAFYWLPALPEMKYTNVFSQIGGGADYKDHFVCISQLWESQWGFGGSIKDCVDGMSFKLGKIYILSSIFVLLFLLLSLFKNNFFIQNKNAITVGFLSIAGFIFATFLTLDVSKTIWDFVPLMSFFQYPWRFLILSSFFLSIFSGSLVFFLERILSIKRLGVIAYVFTGTMLILIFYSNFDLFKPQTIFQTSSNDYIDAIKWKTSKVSDEYMPRDFNKPESLSELPKESVEKVDKVEEVDIVVTEKKTQKLSALISSSRDSKVKVNIAPFPSWKFYINEKKEEAELTNSGYVLLVPSGESKLTAKFQSTGVQKTANFLSITGLLVLFIGIISQSKQSISKKILK